MHYSIRGSSDGCTYDQNHDADADNDNRDRLAIHPLPRHALVIIKLIRLVFLVGAPRGADNGARTSAGARVTENGSAHRSPCRAPNRPG
jgi:hypothetical protein